MPFNSKIVHNHTVAILSWDRNVYWRTYIPSDIMKVFHCPVTPPLPNIEYWSHKHTKIEQFLQHWFITACNHPTQNSWIKIQIVIMIFFFCVHWEVITLSSRIWTETAQHLPLEMNIPVFIRTDRTIQHLIQLGTICMQHNFLYHRSQIKGFECVYSWHYWCILNII